MQRVVIDFATEGQLSSREQGTQSQQPGLEALSELRYEKTHS